jgi:hypothetical protein
MKTIHKGVPMKNKKRLMAAVLPAVLFLFAGCQTTVPVNYTEPARLNLSGVNRIAVDSDNSQAASFISQKLTATGKYAVASEAELWEWKQWKTDRQAREELAARYGQAAEISAAGLVSAYAGNAVRADSLYLGKGVKITAVVNEIGKSARGNYFVRLEGAGGDSVDVFFVPFEISALAAVDKGQTITVIGACRGYNPPDMEDTAEILRILGAGRSVNVVDAVFPGLNDYSGPVDAVISLDTAYSVKDDSHADRRAAVDSNGNYVKDADGKIIYRDVAIYDRSVTVDVDYQVMRARDGSLIGGGTKSAVSRDSNEDPSKVAAPADLAARTINRSLNDFAAEILPTQRSISLTLAKESDNKEAKKEMGGAQKLVKAGNYADAAAAYGKVYARYKNFAAGYNQAVLTEVAAGTEAAVGLMEALSKETGNSMARSALKGMQDRNTANQIAAAQLSQ